MERTPYSPMAFANAVTAIQHQLRQRNSPTEEPENTDQGIYVMPARFFGATGLPIWWMEAYDTQAICMSALFVVDGFKMTAMQEG